MSLIPESLYSGAHRGLAAVGLDRELPPIRRTAEGRVDYEYYLARGRAIRSQAWNDALIRLGHGIHVALFGWVKGWRNWRERQRAIVELWSMDDRMLRDLGLGRAGIFYAIDHGREDVSPPANANAARTKPKAA